MTDQEWMEHRLEEAVWRPDRESCLLFALLKSTPGGFLAEFGVGKGVTLNHIADMTDETVHGFDLFPGLWLSAPPAREQAMATPRRFAVRRARWPPRVAASGRGVVPNARPLPVAFRL